MTKKRILSFEFEYLRWSWTAILAVHSLILLAQSHTILPDSSMNQTLENFVVTGQFVPTDIRKTVNTVRIISGKNITTRGITNLEELLQTEPAIRITQDAVLGSTISINGLKGENLKIMVDGVPVTGRLNGNIDASQLNLNNVKQVEIIEGAQSLMYGSDASAGVINLVSNGYQPTPISVKFRSLYENNGNRSLHLNTGFKWNHFTLQASGGLVNFRPEDDTPQRGQTWNPKDQTNGRLSATYNPSDKLLVTLTGSIFNEEIDNLDSIRRPAFKPYAFDDFYYTLRRDISAHGQGWIGNKYFWQSTIGVNIYDRRKNSYRFDVNADTLAFIPGQQDTTQTLGYLGRFMLASKYKSHINFMLGADTYIDESHGDRISDTLRGRFGYARNNESGIFASLQYKPFTNVTFQPGARLIINETYGTTVTPAAWLAWKPYRNFSLKTSYANGFRSPSLKELYYEFVDANHNLHGSKNLKPERSHNFKFEITYQPLQHAAWKPTLVATAFANRIFNQISLIATDINTVEYSYRNIEKWRTQGLGLALDINHFDYLTLRSNYIYTGYYNTYQDATQTLPTFNFSGDWSNELHIRFFNKRVGVTLWHKLTGETPFFVLQNNIIKENRSSSYHMANASVQSFFLNNKINITAGVKNIFDVRNVELIGDTGVGHTNSNNNRPVHWGRTFFIQLAVDLNLLKNKE